MLADIGREINATLFIFLFFGGKHGCAKMHSSTGFSVKISNLSTIADSFVFAPPPGEIRRRHPQPLQRAHSKTLNKGEEGGENFLIAASPSSEKFDDFF